MPQVSKTVTELANRMGPSPFVLYPEQTLPKYARRKTLDQSRTRVPGNYGAFGRLVVLKSEQDEAEKIRECFLIQKTSVLIGCTQDCDLRLKTDAPNDTVEVSTPQVRLFWGKTQRTWTVQVSSNKENSVLLNGVAPTADTPAEIHDKARLTINGTTLELQLPESAENQDPFGEEYIQLSSTIPYALLIYKAITEALDGKFTYDDICNYIEGNYTETIRKQPNWKSCVSWTLDMSESFQKDDLGFWTVVQEHEHKFKDKKIVFPTNLPEPDIEKPSSPSKSMVKDSETSRVEGGDPPCRVCKQRAGTVTKFGRKVTFTLTKRNGKRYTVCDDCHRYAREYYMKNKKNADKTSSGTKKTIRKSITSPMKRTSKRLSNTVVSSGVARRTRSQLSSPMKETEMEGGVNVDVVGVVQEDVSKGSVDATMKNPSAADEAETEDSTQHTSVDEIAVANSMEDTEMVDAIEEARALEEEVGDASKGKCVTY